MAGFITGFAFGAAQFYLIYLLGGRLTAKDAPGIFVTAMGKLVIWIAFFFVAVLCFRDSIALCGAGAAASLVICGFASFIINMYRQKSSKEAPDTEK